MNAPAITTSHEAAQTAFLQQRSVQPTAAASASNTAAATRQTDQVDLSQSSLSPSIAEAAQTQRLIAQTAAARRAIAAQNNVQSTPFQSATQGARSAANFEPQPLPAPAPDAPDRPGQSDQPQQSFNLTDLKNLLSAFGTREGQEGFNATYDLNGDQLINGADLGLLLGSLESESADRPFTQQDIDGLLQAFGSQPGEQAFTERYDLNGDQLINGADLGLLLGELSDQNGGQQPGESQISSAAQLASRLSEFINSLGLGALLEFRKDLRQRDVELRLAGANDMIADIFRKTRLVELFPMFETAERAVTES